VVILSLEYDAAVSGPRQSMTDLVTKDSPRSVADTVARLTTLVAERGLKLFTVIDHSGEAKAVGLDLRETKVVVFGNPKVGTPVMVSVPPAALDLPLKVLVWDDGGQTRLTYTAPGALAERYGIPEQLAAPLGAIDALTDAAIT
jgi:uncharacterized protein (DUF302 family)